jgi:hypothetical protein
MTYRHSKDATTAAAKSDFSRATGYRIDAEVAKRDIFATCNSLKSRGRSRLMSPIGKY